MKKLHHHVLFRITCILLLGLMTVQCGTLAGRRQLQAFDSEPRGTSIFVPPTYKKDPLLGTTPFVADMSRQYKQDFKYALGRKAKAKELEVKCSYRYGASLLGNVFLSLLFIGNPIVAGGVFSSALMTDFVSGGAYECPDIQIKVENGGRKKPADFCKKIIVAPPIFVDERLSDSVARQWMASSQQMRKCDSFANYRQGKKVFQYLNIDHRNSIYPSMITSFFKLKVAKEANASHLVVLEVDEDQKNWIVSATEIDLYRDDPKQNDAFTYSPQKTYIPKGKYNELSLVEKVSTNTVAQLIAWLPNSLTFSAGISQMNETFPLDASLTSSKQVRSLSRLITGWALSNIGHSSGYSAWDADFKLSPSVDFSFQTYEINSNLVAEDSSLSYFLLDYFFLASTYDASFTLFTPMGGTSFIYGLGYGGFYVNLTDNGDKFTARFVQKVAIRHVAFFTQNVFLKIEASSTVAKRPIINNAVIGLNGSGSATIGIGYFFPAWRYWVQDAIF